MPDENKIIPMRRRKRRTLRSYFLSGETDKILLIIVLVLLAIGLTMLFSASYAVAYYYKGNSTHYILRQLPFALFGVAAMLVVSHIDYHVYHYFVWLLYLISIALLIVVLFMPEINYVHRWIIIGPITFQPSEIAKFAIVMLYSHLISRTSLSSMHTLRWGVLRFLLFLVPIVILMILEPHGSGTILMCVLAAMLLFIGGTKEIYFISAAIAAIIIVVFIMTNQSLLETLAGMAEGDSSNFLARIAARLITWKSSLEDVNNASYQTIQSIYAIGSGRLWGMGIGNSRQKYLYLPEPYNDFIFAIVCEELGFVGAVLILVIFFLLVWRGLSVALRSCDRFGMLLAAGITSHIGVQVLLNVAVATNMIPNTGISLPFFSYGGTSLSMLLAEVGVVLSVARYTASHSPKTDNKE